MKQNWSYFEKNKKVIQIEKICSYFEIFINFIQIKQRWGYFEPWEEGDRPLPTRSDEVFVENEWVPRWQEILNTV